MIPEIRLILFATDLSENSRFAFSYAASLANRYSAKIVILHVLEEISPGASMHLNHMLGGEHWKEFQSQRRQDVFNTVQKRLAEFCEDRREKLTSCPFVINEILVKTGEPVGEILKQAHHFRADMIVMGTHGQGRFTDAMMGSTARRVVRRSKVPVLVVRLPEDG